MTVKLARPILEILFMALNMYSHLSFQALTISNLKQLYRGFAGGVPKSRELHSHQDFLMSWVDNLSSVIQGSSDANNLQL